MSQTDFHTFRVTEIRPETEDAMTVVFHPPAELSETFAYRAGQYVTLRFFIDGKEERRAYSMCSAPHQDEIAVTVKQVKDGVVSNHIARNLKAGDEIDVMPPQGRFLFQPDPAARRDIYLFGAGSGITPLMSILRTALEEEPKSSVYLLYGNRNENSIIFEAELNQLSERYAGQLTVVNTLSKPTKHKASGLKGLFQRSRTDWTGETGRITRVKAGNFIDNHPGSSDDKQFFLCGPGQLIDEVEGALLGRGFDTKQIHHERFVSAHQASKKGTTTGEVAGAKISVTQGGATDVIVLKSGQTVLDGLLEAGKTPPYSCLAGACSTCMAKVTSGGVKMDVCYALDDDEIAEGYVLACQAHPTTPEVSMNFDV